MAPPRVALAHDYLTQRGGAERVVLALTRAFPDAPVHTTVHEADGTFGELAHADVRTTPLQRVGPLRRNPRLALPVLAPVVSRHRIDADVTLCQTTGWAHGFPVTGAKVVYAHNTARWLYQRDEYLANLPTWYRAGLAPLAGPLRRWDRRAAATADVVLAGSAVARDRIRRHWGRDAEIVHPPPGLSADGPEAEVPGLEPGFLLTVARLLPYKRVDVVIAAAASAPAARPLVVVGDGPDAARLADLAPAGTRFVASASDEELRWLYANAHALVTAAHEDFGLTPLEAMGFGTPTVAVAEGGFLETVEPGVSGLLFDEPTPGCLTDALAELERASWDRQALRSRARRFSEEAFAARMQSIVHTTLGMPDHPQRQA